MPSSVILSKAPIKCLNIFRNHLLLKKKVCFLSTLANFKQQPTLNSDFPSKNECLPFVDSSFLKSFPLEVTFRPISNKKQHLENTPCTSYSASKDASIPSNRDKVYYSPKDLQKNTPKQGKPSSEQLIQVYTKLSETLPNFFIRPSDYSFYHDDLVFVNNFKGTVTNGINNYVKQMALFRMFGHFFYAHIKLRLLHLSKDETEGTVKIHWQVIGMSGFRAFLRFWRLEFWNWSKTIATQKHYIEGISVYHVGDDGLVFKHVVDKIISQRDVIPPKANEAIALKLAMILGLAGHDIGNEIATLSDATALVETIARDLM